jgi:RNA polymerase sigma factor (sigma-70 family)
MIELEDKKKIDRLKNEDGALIELLYKFYFPSVAFYVKQNAGNDEDAKDMFQEAIIVLLQKVRQPDFVLSSSLKTYLYAIAKNLWLKHLRDNKLVPIADDLQLQINQIEAEINDHEFEVKESKEQQVQNWLQKITPHCRRILKAIFFNQEPMDSLMVKMGWKNKHTAANQKYKCLEQLKKETKKEAV